LRDHLPSSKTAEISGAEASRATRGSPPLKLASDGKASGEDQP
jgi:hypothetical protein